MSAGKHTLHKQHKMGQLSGDIPRRDKISMLERGVRPGYWEVPDIRTAAKGYKRNFVKKANRAFRRQLVAINE